MSKNGMWTQDKECNKVVLCVVHIPEKGFLRVASYNKMVSTLYPLKCCFKHMVKRPFFSWEGSRGYILRRKTPELQVPISRSRVCSDSLGIRLLV